MGAVVGIDLGTTNTVVAAARDGNVVALPDESGSTLIPSVVSFLPSGAVLVGNAANERRSVEARNTIYSIKRLIGRTWGSAEVEQAVARFPFELREGPGRATFVMARGETYTLPEISAFVLRKAKSIAELELEETVDRAVITVPANFNDLQRAATKVAGRVAGLEVLRVLNEPTAAALAFGYAHGNRECIAVYDLGGGTFDFTLLRLTDDVFEVLATAGDTYLGGDDIDAAIADRIARRTSSSDGLDAENHPDAFEQLRSAAEKIKVTLSTASDARIRLKDYEIANADEHEFSMGRSELDAIEAPILERTLEICRSALKVAGLSHRDIAHVLLVGGATRDPYIRRGAERFFERSARSDIDPHEVVALGAARHAMALTQLRATASGIPIAPARRQPQRDVDSPDLHRKRTDSGVGTTGAVAPARVSAPPPELPESPSAPTTQTLGSRDRRTTGLGIGPSLDNYTTTTKPSVFIDSPDEAKHGRRPAEPPFVDSTLSAPKQTALSIRSGETAAAMHSGASKPAAASAAPVGVTQQETPKSATPARGTRTGRALGTNVVPTVAGLGAEPVRPAAREPHTSADRLDLPATQASAVVNTTASARTVDTASSHANTAAARRPNMAARDLPASLASAIVNTTSPDKQHIESPPASTAGTAALRARATPIVELPNAIATAIVGSSAPTTGAALVDTPPSQGLATPRAVSPRARKVETTLDGTPIGAMELPLIGMTQPKSPQRVQPRPVELQTKATTSVQGGSSPSRDDDANDNEPTITRNAYPSPTEPDTASLVRPASSQVAEDNESGWDLLAPVPRATSQEQSPAQPENPDSTTTPSRLSEAEIRARYGDLPLIVGGRRVGALHAAAPPPVAAPPLKEHLPITPEHDAPSALELGAANPLGVSKHDRPALERTDIVQRTQPGATGSGRQVGAGPALSPSDEVTVTKRIQAPSLTEKSTPFAGSATPPTIVSLEPDALELETAPESLPASSQLEPLQATPIAADEQVQKPQRLHSARPSARQNLVELELPVPGIPQRSAPPGFSRAGAVPDQLGPRYPAAIDAEPQKVDEPKPPSRPPEFRQKPESAPAGMVSHARANQAFGGATLPLPTRSLPNTALAPGAVELRGISGGSIPPLLSNSTKGTSLRPVLLMDVTPLSLCVETVGGYVDVLLNRNSPVPCERTCEFVTANDNQQTVIIRIAQGESRFFRENVLLGEVQLTGIPPRSRGESRIAVTFGIDSNGILHVRALDLATGLSAVADLRLSGAPAAVEIAQMTTRQTSKRLQ